MKKDNNNHTEPIINKLANRAGPVLIRVATAALLHNLLTPKEKKSEEIKLRKTDVYDVRPMMYAVQNSTIDRNGNNDWVLAEYDYDARRYIKRYSVLKAAETFDGDVDQKDIRAINQDGDSFNLNVGGRTRHAKYLVCTKV